MGKRKEKKQKGKKPKKMVMMACCPDESVREEFKEEILMKLGDKFGGRGNVVMTRLNDDDLQKIDALVEIEAFKSRSEAVAFFIKEGVNARKDLFQRVMPTVEKIRDLKVQAKKSLSQGQTPRPRKRSRKRRG